MAQFVAQPVLLVDEVIQALVTHIKHEQCAHPWTAEGGPQEMRTTIALYTVVTGLDRTLGAASALTE